MNIRTLQLGILIFLVSCGSTPKVPDTVSPKDHDITEESKPVEKSQDLLALAKNGDLEGLEELFERFKNIDAQDETQNTALHYAVQANRADLVEYLIIQGANPNILNQEGTSPFIIALTSDNMELIHPFLKSPQLEIFPRFYSPALLPVRIIIRRKLCDYFWDNPAIEKTDPLGNNVYHYLALEGDFEQTSNLPLKESLFDSPNGAGLRPVDLALTQPASQENARLSYFLFSRGAASPKDSRFEYVFKLARLKQPHVPLEDGQTGLHHSASKNHLGFLSFWLEKGGNPDVSDVPGATPLHRAVQNNHMESISLLLNHGAGVNAQDYQQYTPFHYALINNVPRNVVDTLLDAGADVNIKDLWGNTPLHLSEKRPDGAGIALRLLNNGALVNARNKEGNTPLLQAVRSYNRAYAQVLIETGGNIFASNYKGETPLIAAVRQGVDTLSWFLRPKDLFREDDGGNTPLHTAVRYTNNPAVIEYLIASGAPINAQERGGNTPLHIALNLDKKALGQILLNSKADVFRLNKEGENPLRLLMNGDQDYFRQVLKGSSLLKQTDSRGNSALHYGAAWENKTGIQTLLKSGADPNQKDLNKRPPLFTAVQKGNLSLLEAFLLDGADLDQRDLVGNTLLHEAVRWDQLSMAARLIQLGVDSNTRNIEGKTPLFLAMESSNIDFFELLVTAGANLEITNLQGLTPLFITFGRNRTDLADRLIQEGADLMARDDKGNTLLHYAVKEEAGESINYLLNKDMNIFALNQHNETPAGIALSKGTEVLRKLVSHRNKNTRNDKGNNFLHMAVERKAEAEIINYLLSLHIDVNAKNKDGLTALDLALENKTEEIAQILMNNGAKVTNP